MNIPVMQEGMLSLAFDENDVRETCRMLKCRKKSEECMALMPQHSVRCMACYTVLRLLNRPFTIRISRRMAEQRN